MNNIVHKLRTLVLNEAFGGVLLIVCTLLALLVQNGSFSEHYREFLNLKVGFSVGEFELNKPFLLWINDGLISIFFFAIGLELKKEFCTEILKILKILFCLLWGHWVVYLYLL